MTTGMIKEHCVLEPDSLQLLQRAYNRFQYSARTYHKFLKVARTFADMEGSKKIRRKDIALALLSRDFEKGRQGFMVV
jgi:magnesium chelatase family protein